MSVGALIEKFRAVALDRVEKMNLNLVELERTPKDQDKAQDLLREVHTLKGEAKMMGFADVNLVAHLTEHILLKISDNTAPELNSSLVDVVFSGLDILRSLLTKEAGASRPIDLAGFVDRVTEARLEDGIAPRPQKAPEAKPLSPPMMNAEKLKIRSQATFRIDLDKLERLGESAGEVLLMSRRLDYRMGELEKVRDNLRTWTRRVRQNLPKSQATEIRALNHQLNTVLTSTQDEVYQASRQSSNLDHEARRLRHVRLAQVLSHYPRAIRDLAMTQGKRVRFVHEFGDVEVDHFVLEGLSDPLLHLIRNAVDHGIEAPEIRRAQGKEEEGEIRLIAEYTGDSITVSLKDDGAGIDPAEIRKKAVSRDLYSEEQVQGLKEREVIQLIFRSGFSTRDLVTDVSGRGLGMDVVLRQITNIGGSVEVNSELGRGTHFKLKIPISSAISSILMIRIGGSAYAVPAKDVERVDVVRKADIAELHGGFCIRWESEMIALVDWSELLGVKGRQFRGDQITILLMKRGTKNIAVWVDEVLGETEAINRPLGNYLSGVQGCRGIALTDAGQVLPLIGIGDVVGQVQTLPSDATDRLRSTLQSAALAIKTILVTEDSEVTRELVSEILRAQGYRVLTAEDGHIALQKLEAHRIDLLLTDVQMPRVDGLELLRRVRADTRYSALPVVMLTTLNSNEDRERAMALGANGYLPKLDFREQDLLVIVDRYLGEIE